MLVRGKAFRHARIKRVNKRIALWALIVQQIIPPNYDQIQEFFKFEKTRI